MSRGSARLMWSVSLSDNIYKKEWSYIVFSLILVYSIALVI
jgi:hypothetical protein